MLLARSEPTVSSWEGTLGFWDRVRRRIAAIPGATAVAVGSAVPFGGGYAENGFEIEGRPPPDPGEPAWIGQFSTVSPGWFEALGIPVLEGRAFRESDGPDATPVAIVSRTLARRYLPGGDFVGTRIRALGREEGSPWLAVVGVVDDVRALSPREEPRPMWYVPHAQVERSYPPAFFGRAMTIAVRGAGEPAALAGPVRAAVRKADAGVPVWDVRPMSEATAAVTNPERFTTTLMTAFAAIAGLLGALGIYAVLAYHVARRRREMGIRSRSGRRRGASGRSSCGRACPPSCSGSPWGSAARWWPGGRSRASCTACERAIPRPSERWPRS